MTPRRCPLCGEADCLEPCSDTQWATDEKFDATHRCTKCHRAFRWTPPSEPFNPIKIRGAA